MKSNEQSCLKSEVRERKFIAGTTCRRLGLVLILLPPKIWEEVLAKVSPTKEEVDKQKATIHQISAALRLHAEGTWQYSFIEAQGSTGAKQTQLRGSADIDLFVGLRPEEYSQVIALPSKKKQKALGHLLDGIVDQWFIPVASSLGATGIQKTYSEHPYLSLTMNGLDVDILCCFDLSRKSLQEEGPITAVDRTVHHSKYVAKNLDDRKRGDVRILKSFVRASHAYGDTCAVGRMGFTGYSLELLVLHSNSLGEAFETLMDLDQRPLDPNDRTLDELRDVPTYRDDHVFIIDPTDTNRNVASSFDRRSYDWIKLRGKMLLKMLEEENSHSALELLVEQPIPDYPIPNWLVPHSIALEYVSDGTQHYTVLRDKLHRLARKISTHMEKETTGEERFGRVLSEVYFEGSSFAMGFIVERPDVSSEFVRKGPPIELREAAESFLNANPGAFEKDGYLWTMKEREWTEASGLLGRISTENPVKGLSQAEGTGVVSARVLNVLYRYVLEIEKDFPVSN